MKFAITLTLFLASLNLFSQAAPQAEPTVTYEFIGVTPDSFFIARIETAAPTKESPMPTSVRTPIVFYGMADFEAKIKNTRAQVTESRQKADELKKQAQKLDQMILDFEGLVEKNEKFFKKTDQVKN